MTTVGNEYIFNYRIESVGDTDEDIELCINNSGLNCIVISDKGEREFGHCYEVESCTGSQFFAYESELDELKDGDIRCWK